MDTYVHYLKYGGVAEDAREARYRRTHACTYVYVFAVIQLVAMATIRERRLFRSALAQVRLLFESGVYSREASIRSYTVCKLVARYSCSILWWPCCSTSSYRVVHDCARPLSAFLADYLVARHPSRLPVCPCRTTIKGHVRAIVRLAPQCHTAI